MSNAPAIAEKVSITGVGISNIDIEELISIFNQTIEEKNKIQVCVTPVNCLVYANKKEFLKNL
ncbi:MAG: hypothetical protein KGO81_11195 [Bacteroidota bacterium]|nr:hypothetical protein [Bacteroidota bacterium]